ncbi:MAG: hypothetical protein WAM14_03890 [Candidatus Nitrosopolaris sp.]
MSAMYRMVFARMGMVIAMMMAATYRRTIIIQPAKADDNYSGYESTSLMRRI